MKVPMFSVRDKLSGFGWPTIDTNERTAQRNFAAAVNSPQANNMTFAPGDYDLYLVGYFDSETGLLTPTETSVPQFVCSGSQVFGIHDNNVKE